MEGLILAAIISFIGMLVNRRKEQNQKEQKIPRRSEETQSSTLFETFPEEAETKVEASIDRYNDNKERQPIIAEEKRYTPVRSFKPKNDRANPIKNQDITRTYHAQFRNKQDIVKGIIFSEVFGPPRSKKRTHRS